MDKEKLELVLFDIGNVLSGNFDQPLYRRFAQELGVSYEELWAARKGHWVPFELGQITEREYWEGMKIDLGLPYTVEELRRMPYERMFPIPGSLEIARELAAKYRLGIISNHTDEWTDYIIESHGLEELFDPIIISSHVALRKPGLAIYELTLERAGVPAERALFIDDKPENIAAARRLGMQGIVFENPTQLREDLAKYL